MDTGNTLLFYSTNTSAGKFTFEENSTYSATLLLKDAYGNKSALDFDIQCASGTTRTISTNVPSKINTIDDVLVIENKDSTIQVKTKNETNFLKPAYGHKSGNTFLWDMKKNEAPITITMANEVVSFPETVLIPPGKDFTFYNNYVEVDFTAKTLFDTVFFSVEYTYDTLKQLEIFQLGNPGLYPLKHYFNAILKMNKKYTDARTSIYEVLSDDNYGYVNSTMDGNSVNFSSRAFGKYTLLVDSVAPSISPLNVTMQSLKFKISDDLSGIATFSTYVNNEWILMDYDYKTKLLWSDDIGIVNENFNVKVVVEDNVGNKAVYETQL